MSSRLFRFKVQVGRVLDFQAELPLLWSVFQLKFFLVKVLAKKELKLETWQLEVKQEGRTVSNSQRLEKLAEQVRVHRISSAQLREISRNAIDQRRKNIIELVRRELARSEKVALWMPEIGVGNHFSQIKQPAEQAEPNQPRFLLNLIFLTFVFINKLTFKAVVVCALLFAVYMVFKLFNNEQQPHPPRPAAAQEPAVQAEIVPFHNPQVQPPIAQQNVSQLQGSVESRSDQQIADGGDQVSQRAQGEQIKRTGLRVRMVRVGIMVVQMVYCYFCSLFPNWSVSVHLNMHKKLIERLKMDYFPQLVPA